VSELQFLHTVAEVFVALELDVIVVADWLYVLAVLVLAHVTDQQHVTVGYVARVLARVCRRISHTTTQPPFIVTRPN